MDTQVKIFRGSFGSLGAENDANAFMRNKDVISVTTEFFNKVTHFGGGNNSAETLMAITVVYKD